jgi:aspartate ammonia-lyase
MPKYRLESDSVGEKKVPAGAYYGVQSLRAHENFPITGEKNNPHLIRALVYIKKAAAITNRDGGLLDQTKAAAIIQACDEILAGKLHDEFIVDPIQGGAGTSMNMNANEVIANRANEILGHPKGSYTPVHPNDDVNMGQSTNDVYPSAGKIATLYLLSELDHQLCELDDAFLAKSREFDKVIKMGRTQLQDAVPIRLGQEFGAYRVSVRRARDRLREVSEEMTVLNMGATAIGTGINADVYYEEHIVPNLAALTGYDLTQAVNLVDATQNVDSFLAVSGAVKAAAVALSKIASDLRLMSSGPRAGLNEINLPARQNGSSIMPGKVNPVIPEVVNQIAFNIMGNDAAIAIACESGQLELNAFEPVIFYNLFQSIQTLSRGVRTFIDHCVTGITANTLRCKGMVDNSVGIITALNPYLGYRKAAEIAKLAQKTGKSVKSLVLEQKLMSRQKLATILDPEKMTTPGIKGKRNGKNEPHQD